MKKVNNSKKKLNKKAVLIVILFLITIITTICFFKSILLLKGIENKARFLVCITLIIVIFWFLWSSIIAIKNKNQKNIFLIIFSILYSIFLFVGSFYINKTYKVISSLTTSVSTYYSSMITLSTNKADSISDIGTGIIGILSDSSSVEGNQIPNEIINDEKIKNQVKEYDDYIDLLSALYSKDVDYIFVPASYAVMFSNLDGNDYSKIADETKVIFTKEKSVSKDETKGTSLNKPFTVLVMGVDSEQEGISGASFNGDALMLITFNPTTLNTTILSIPRDSYVPIACFTNQTKNKITHAAWYGSECMSKTISNFLDVYIDYYVKINFKGVVGLVDTLGGVEVEVPYSFCEQNSDRAWGNNIVYVEQGLRTLNGEEALALSRNRKSHSDMCDEKWTQGVRNDFVRGQNQQLVLRALLNKLKEISSLDSVYDVLDTISNNMETNMSTSEILSLYNIAKDIIVRSNSSDVDDLLGFQRLYLNGEDAYIYDSRSGLNLYNYVLYDASIKAVSNAMKVNLGITEPTLVKNFSFDINEEYEQTIIGKNEKGASSVVKLPSFIGLTESAAKTKANSLGITVSFKYVTTGSGTDLTVISQSSNVGTDVSYVKTLTLTVLKKEEKTDTSTTTDKNTSTSVDKDTNTTTDKNDSGTSNTNVSDTTENNSDE